PGVRAPRADGPPPAPASRAGGGPPLRRRPPAGVDPAAEGTAAADRIPRRGERHDVLRPAPDPRRLPQGRRRHAPRRDGPARPRSTVHVRPAPRSGPPPVAGSPLGSRPRRGASCRTRRRNPRDLGAGDIGSAVIESKISTPGPPG